jgi:hypothetical protein
MSTVETVHAEIAEGVIDEATDEEGLTLMLLLHTHRLTLTGAVLTDRPGVVELAPLTQRHSADVVAQVWPSSDRERASASHWYSKFQQPVFEIVDELPSAWVRRVDNMRARLAAHPLVASLVFEA